MAGPHASQISDPNVFKLARCMLLESNAFQDAVKLAAHVRQIGCSRNRTSVKMAVPLASQISDALGAERHQVRNDACFLNWMQQEGTRRHKASWALAAFCGIFMSL